MPSGEEDKGAGSEPAQRVHDSETIIGPGAAGARGAAGDAPTPGGVATLDEFSRALVEIGLIDQAELDSFAADSTDGVLGLSRALVKAGKLTPYQAAAVYQKKSRGLLIGNYLILDKLGQGGMGVVFKARHRRLTRVGALKILPPSFARDRDAVMRFRREVEAAGRLKHPNLVAAQDADEDRGVHFLVMDYVEGRDLDRIVRDRGPMPVAQAIDCLIQAARGLEAAHAQGIIHRDIKPGNLMLENAGTVRVLDLGLARIVDAGNPFGKSTAGRLTQSGMYMGTIDFMAPEQAEDSHRVDHRADIYSLGCTAHYLFTGREPFLGETVLKRLMAHMERPAPSLRIARPDVTPTLDAVYLKMMAKRPEDRPASMTEVISLLEACKSAAIAPKSKPELMVFNEQPVKRAGASRARSDPPIAARPKDAEGQLMSDELDLEDLVMDVRPAPPTPLSPARMPAPAQTLKRTAAPQSRGGPARRPRSNLSRTINLVCNIAAVVAVGTGVIWLVVSLSGDRPKPAVVDAGPSEPVRPPAGPTVPQPSSESTTTITDAKTGQGPIKKPATVAATNRPSTTPVDVSSDPGKSLSTRPNDARLSIERGRELAGLGRMSEANDCFTHAAELAPDQPQLFVDAGWWVAGPYPVDRILQAPLESDPAPDPSKPADVFATEPRRWQNVRTEPQGKVDLGSIFHADKIEAYALAIVYSASKRDVVAVLSNDDEASYWLNGRHFLDAPFIPSEAGRPMLMTLQAGRNTILAKVINQRLGHAMSVQFSEVPADVVRAFAGAGKWAQAADEYSKVLANESGKANRATHNDAGRAYAELGRWKDAAAAFKRAYNLDSKNYETRQDLLRCYLALNDAASYQPLCKKLIEDYRKDQHPTIRNDVIWNAALLPGALPDYSEVLQIAAKLMDLKTAGATYFNTYGAIIYRAKHYSAAVNYLTKSIHAKAGKGDAFDLVFLAMARHRLKQPGASDALKQAVALANHASYNWEFRIEIQTLLDEAKMELSLP